MGYEDEAAAPAVHHEAHAPAQWEAQQPAAPAHAADASHHHASHHGHPPQHHESLQEMLAPHVAYQPDVVHASHGDYYDNLGHALNNLSTRVVALAGKNGAAIARAGQAFKSEYAMGRIHELQGRMTGEDLAKQLVRSVMDIVGVRVIATLGRGAVKVVAEQLSVALARKTSNAAKSAFSVEGLAADLSQGLEHFITEIQTLAAVAEETAQSAVRDALAPAYAAVQSRQPLSEEDAEWAMRIFDGSDAQIDEVIEQYFGIPGAERTRELELAVFHRLVEDFETNFQLRTNESHYFPQRRSAGEEWRDDPYRLAHKAAEEASERRAEHLHPPQG